MKKWQRPVSVTQTSDVPERFGVVDTKSLSVNKSWMDRDDLSPYDNSAGKVTDVLKYSGIPQMERKEEKMKRIWIFVFLGIMFLPQALVAQQAFPRVGVWDVTARDHRIVWTRSALVIEVADGDAFRGYFDWYSIMNSEGREYFVGFYDRRNRKVEIRGERLSNNAKGLGLGIYTAYLSQNGRDLEEGTWISMGGPGSWEAKWRQQSSSPEQTQGNNYYYEPSVSVVTGLLTTKTVDTTELWGTGLQNIYVLNTTNPINIINTYGNRGFDEETVYNISTIQLTATYIDFSAYKGRQVRLTGKFFFWHTGHHYTKVLMYVDRVEVL
jgi:hypothetical protein